MGRQKAEQEPPPGAPQWLVTFSDLVSLLVTLFIMMLTFSTQETHDLRKAMDMIKGSFGILFKQVRDAPDIDTLPQLAQNVRDGVVKHDPDEDPALEARVRQLDGFIVESSRLDQGLRIIPETTTGFAPGDDNPSPQLAEELRGLGRMLKRHRSRRFVIEGHVDPSSDRSATAYGADVLALSRARRVARVLGLQGLRYEHIVIASKGKRVPRGDLWTDAGQAKNRRIEIVVLPAVVRKQ